MFSGKQKTNPKIIKTMEKLTQIHVSYVCAKGDNNGVIFGDKIIEINNDTITLVDIRKQLAKDLKVTSPDIVWDEVTILNFRPMEDFLGETEYLHVSYVCSSPGFNDPTFGDSIIHIGDKDVTLVTIYNWLSDVLRKEKPGIKYTTPIIIDLQPIPRELALQLAPELKKQ